MTDDAGLKTLEESEVERLVVEIEKEKEAEAEKKKRERKTDIA